MTGGKLITLLQKFDAKSLFRLRDFVQSPYHNKNKHVNSLFNYLYKQAPFYKESKLGKEVVYATLFPKKAFNDLKFRHVQSMLLKVCEEFLAIEALQTDGIQKDIYKLEALRAKQQFKHFYEIERQARKAHDKTPTSETKGYLQGFLLDYELESALETDKGLANTPKLQSASVQLDNYYLIQKLKLACAEKAYASVYKQTAAVSHIEAIIQLAELTEKPTPLLQLYTWGIKTFQPNEDNQAFQNLKTLLAKYTKQVAVTELKQLHTIARNYCIRKLNSGATAYVQELFDLYRLGLAAGAMYNEDGNMSPAAYKNIVSVGLKLKEYAWIEQFIEEQAKRLEDKYRTDYHTYNMAKLRFEQLRFSDAISLLSQVDYVDVFVSADARTLLLKCYFELTEFEAMDALFSSFRLYIERRKELAYHQENYLNTIRFTKRISNLKPKDRKANTLLQSKIEATTVLTERDWLLAKLKELR